MLSSFGRVHPEPIGRWREGNSPHSYGVHVLHCCMHRQERQPSGGRGVTDPLIIIDCARPLQWILLLHVCLIKTWVVYPLKCDPNQEMVEYY